MGGVSSPYNHYCLGTVCYERIPTRRSSSSPSGVVTFSPSHWSYQVCLIICMQMNIFLRLKQQQQPQDDKEGSGGNGIYSILGLKSLPTKKL